MTLMFALTWFFLLTQANQTHNFGGGRAPAPSPAALPGVTDGGCWDPHQWPLQHHRRVRKLKQINCRSSLTHSLCSNQQAPAPQEGGLPQLEASFSNLQVTGAAAATIAEEEEHVEEVYVPPPQAQAITPTVSLL